MSYYRCIHRLSAILVFGLLITGCSSIHHKPISASSSSPHKIAIFFDGTNNDAASDTNVKRLHSLVSLQGKRNISSIYIEGVGADRKLIGMLTGFGQRRRVLMAYEFILEHYRPGAGDEIYIFGFSRGAYAARILTSILYNAGIVTGVDTSASDVARVVYDASKLTPRDGNECRRNPSDCKRKEKISGALSGEGLTVVKAPISVEVLGLWDTVEALGIPNWTSRLLHKMKIKQHIADIDGPNTQYDDQLCNVKRAYQALSIDDNREWIFTPLPLSRTYLFKLCDSDNLHLLDEQGTIIPERFREVWFSGSHTDVGGGYPDSLMDGVSLNWMIENLKDTDLLPVGAKVPADAFGTSHDPEAGVWGPAYRHVERDITAYVTDKKQYRKEFHNSLCVHPTVLKRRRTVMPLKDHEYQGLSLKNKGLVYLVPEKTRKGWTPRLREADPGSEAPLKITVDVWPNCKGMK